MWLRGAGLAAIACGVLALPASAAARGQAKPSANSDKRCAKGARSVDVRKGTFRIVQVRRDGQLRAAACDTRFGRFVLLALPGANRNDGAGSLVRRAGTRAIVRGYRTHRRGPTRGTVEQFVDLEAGTRQVLDGRYGQRSLLRADGVFVFVDRLLRTLVALGNDGRADTVGAPAKATGRLADISVRGRTVSYGPADRRLTVDVDAAITRLRACQPGRTGTRDVATVSSFDDALRIWTDRAGVARACPAVPTGELRLPCSLIDRGSPPPVHLGALAFAGPRLIVQCTGAPDSATLLDTSARSTVATFGLGGVDLAASMAISVDGVVAFTGRADGADAREANVLWVAEADGAGQRVVGQAGHLIRNVRFTGPRSLAWTEIERPDGPALSKSAEV